MIEIVPYLRQFKIGPFAIFDTLISYLGVYLLAPLLSKLFAKLHIKVSTTSWIWLTLPISVLFHVVFTQNTPLMKMLVDPNGFYLVKALLLVMLFVGVKEIKVQK